MYFIIYNKTWALIISLKSSTWFIIGITNIVGTYGATMCLFEVSNIVKRLGSYEAFLILTSMLYFNTTIFYSLCATTERIIWHVLSFIGSMMLNIHHYSNFNLIVFYLEAYTIFEFIIISIFFWKDPLTLTIMLVFYYIFYNLLISLMLFGCVRAKGHI